ncbi:hypothetical protein N9B68_01840 [bacterium]|nr:hypothetical protein [bacterium]
MTFSPGGYKNLFQLDHRKDIVETFRAANQTYKVWWGHGLIGNAAPSPLANFSTQVGNSLPSYLSLQGMEPIGASRTTGTYSSNTCRQIFLLIYDI